MPASIRPAEPSDAAAVAEIHNQGIAERQATFETAAQTAAGVAALIEGDDHPFLVAEEDGRVLGWGRLSAWLGKAYYDGVVEASIYVARDARGRGLGPALLAALAEAADRDGYWKIVALLFPANRGSVAMFERAGYREVGVFRRHGRLDGEWRDVVVFELAVGEGRG
jgi:phosphinothricin acetyltransferase